MRFDELVSKSKEVVKEKPELKNQILELIDYAVFEIQDGGSEENECDLAWRDIKELIK